MRKIIYLFENYWSSILSTLIAGLSVISLSLLMPQLRNEKSEKTNTLKQHQKEFFDATDKLTNRNDSLSINIETIKKIFNSVDRQSKGTLLNYGFINTLEDYSVYLISDTTKNNGNDKFSLILKLINEEIEGKPFNNLYAEQKRILFSLQKSINNQDIQTAEYNLNELNDMLIVQNATKEKLEQQTSWSIPLAIAGIILTFIFGIVSLLVSLPKKRNNGS